VLPDHDAGRVTFHLATGEPHGFLRDGQHLRRVAA
jgi:hypothetical protein